MSKVLVLTSSVLGDASVSNQLTTHIVNQLRLKNGKSKVIARDLGSNPVPHLTQDSTIALRVPEAENEVQANAQALSDESCELEPAWPGHGGMHAPPFFSAAPSRTTHMGTVAILAQGTSWAVAVTQAFFDSCRPHIDLSLGCRNFLPTTVGRKSKETELH